MKYVWILDCRTEKDSTLAFIGSTKDKVLEFIKSNKDFSWYNEMWCWWIGQEEIDSDQGVIEDQTFVSVDGIEFSHLTKLIEHQLPIFDSHRDCLEGENLTYAHISTCKVKICDSCKQRIVI